MKRCKYCHKRLWFWQSYSWLKQEQTHGYAVLIHTDYEDVYFHDSCFFHTDDWKQILLKNDDEIYTKNSELKWDKY